MLDPEKVVGRCAETTRRALWLLSDVIDIRSAESIRVEQLIRQVSEVHCCIKAKERGYSYKEAHYTERQRGGGRDMWTMTPGGEAAALVEEKKVQMSERRVG